MLAASAASASGQDVDSEAGEPPRSPEVVALQENIDRLVEELASPAFAKRQDAVTQLLEQEAPAVALLEEALQNATEPVAVQLRPVIAKLRKRLFDDRVQAIIATNDVSKLAGMPDWDRFTRITGKTQDALPVYMEMLQVEKKLFADRMFSSSDLSDYLEERSKALRAASDGQSEEDFPVAAAAALMLIASDENVVLRRGTSTYISESLIDARFGKLITDGYHAGILRAVTSEWLKRPGLAVDRPLLISMEHRLPVGREIALRTLERKVFNQSSAYSLLYLGLLQQTDTLKEVEKVMNDDTASRPVWPLRGKAVTDLVSGREVKSTYSVQVRDVALAVAIHLRGRRPQEFGMDVSLSELQLFTLDSMGFNSDEDRNAAYSQYRSAFP
jgi:hypothetical protein